MAFLAECLRRGMTEGQLRRERFEDDMRTKEERARAVLSAEPHAGPRDLNPASIANDLVGAAIARSKDARVRAEAARRQADQMRAHGALRRLFSPAARRALSDAEERAATAEKAAYDARMDRDDRRRLEAAAPGIAHARKAERDRWEQGADVRAARRTLIILDDVREALRRGDPAMREAARRSLADALRLAEQQRRALEAEYKRLSDEAMRRERERLRRAAVPHGRPGPPRMGR